MNKTRAYDLPVRIFHWAFVVLFVTSFTIANVIDDDSWVFAYHMLSGILMVSVVLLRIVWGFVGSKTSRFSSFVMSPVALLRYLKSIVSGQSKRYLGHNPASSYVAVILMLFALCLGFSGLMMVFDINKHFFEELHELLANGFLIVVILHITGGVLHQIKHKDGLLSSMVSGNKAEVDGAEPIKSNRSGFALFYILFIISFGGYLLSNFDANSGKLTVLGQQIQLSEDERHDDHKNDYPEKAYKGDD